MRVREPSPRDSLTHAVATFLAFAALGACGGTPAPRPPAAPADGSARAQPAQSRPAPSPGLTREGARGASREAAGSAVDTLRPTRRLVALGPPGVPATAFPAPDRPVAGITTDTWSDESTRDKAREAQRVMSLLHVREGMRVADIGAGSGYYTLRLSRRVGPGGTVLAQDIMPEYLEKLAGRVKREGLDNVRLGLGDAHDPRLPPSSIDLAILVHMYHEVAQPYGLLYNLLPALRSGARVGVVDLDRKTSRHGTPKLLLRCEFRAAGYRHVSTHDLAKGSGYLAVFEPVQASGERPLPHSIQACAA
ncbi:MAG: methyltransferase domain-containing protein [Gemmatimonadetes bacterium]|nr:methyltransferase domain-containing protein [Gemmatimonadota bacterium]